MIDPEGRLWAGWYNLPNGGPYTWHITDLDQRRQFAVRYEAWVEDVEATEQICMDQIRKHVDDLGDGVYGISFTQWDGPVTHLTDPDDDVTAYVNNFPLSALGLPFPVKTVFLSSLTELDRMGPDVDLVSYQEAPSAAGATAPSPTKVAFKYWFMHDGMFRTWHELNCWSRLPRDHPHIVPFDSVVLDPHTHGIVGFTTRYIGGGTLHANNATKRPFRLGWLRQLLSAVDDLNYRYGIMHQDIAPRNILIDERDNLRIFDFNHAIMIDKDYYTSNRDDTKGAVFTLYEIITLDEHFRQDPEVMETWEKHPDVKLDADVAEFRAVLGEWVPQRKAREFFKPTATWVRWPKMLKPPVATVPAYEYHEDGGKTITGTKTGLRAVVTRQQLVDLGAEYWDWERPASYKLREALPEEDWDIKDEAVKDQDMDGVMDQEETDGVAKEGEKL